MTPPPGNGSTGEGEKKKDAPGTLSVVLTSVVVAALVSGVFGLINANTQRDTARDQVGAQLVGIAANVLTSQGKVDQTLARRRDVINHYSPIKLGSTTTLPSFPWGICTPDGPAAIVSPTGDVGGCHSGTAVITLRAGDQTAKTTVTVAPPHDSTHRR